MTEFFLNINPPRVTHQQKKVAIKNGKFIFYNPERLENAKELFNALLYQHKPPNKYTKAVELLVKWCFPKGRHKDGTYKTTRPDTDNLQKLLKDCMTDCGYWTDDALVAREIAEKFWAETPGIYVRITEL